MQDFLKHEALQEKAQVWDQETTIKLARHRYTREKYRKNRPWEVSEHWGLLLWQAVRYRLQEMQGEMSVCFQKDKKRASSNYNMDNKLTVQKLYIRNITANQYISFKTSFLVSYFRWLINSSFITAASAWWCFQK